MKSKCKAIVLTACLAIAAASLLPWPGSAKAESGAPPQTMQSLDLMNDRHEPIRLQGSEQFSLKWSLPLSVPTSLAADEKGNLYAADMYEVYGVNPEGKVLWSYSFGKSDLSGLRYMRMGHDGNLYLFEGRSFFGETNSKGSLIVLNTEGKVVREVKLLDVAAEWASPFTTDIKGNLIVVTEQGLASVNKEGRSNWVNNQYIETTDYGSNIRFSNIYGIETDRDGAVYVTGDKGLLYALDAATGKVKWKTTDVKGNVYVDNDGFLYIVNDLGLITVNAQTGERVNKTSQGITAGKLNQLHIPNDGDGGLYLINVYAADDGDRPKSNSIKLVSQDGTVKWTYRTPDSQYGGASGLVSDSYGHAYFADEGGNIYALDRTGKERFVLFSNNSISSGTQLIASPHGELFALNSNYGLARLGYIVPPITVTIDGQEVIFSDEPRLEAGAALVPMRAVFEQLNAKVAWDNDTRTVTANKAGKTVSLTIGSDTAKVNYKEVKLDAAPAIIQGSTFVPLRFIGEALGAQVEWDGTNRTIHITTNSSK